MTRTQRGTAHLSTLAFALAAAFVVLPRPVASALSGQSYGDEQHLSVTVSAAFVGYWQIGRRALTPELARLVDYWRWYHVVKGVTAIGLLVVLIVLATRLFTAYAGTGRPSGTNRHEGAWSSATGGVLVTGLSVVAFALALANVQGTFAPFSSLMSMLPVNTAQGQLAGTIGLIKNDLAHYPSGSSGALRMMVGDFATYHVVVAVISGFAAVALIVLTIASWRTYARTPADARRPRRLVRSLGVASMLGAALITVLSLANTSAAVDSAAAVLNFYRGTF